MTKPELIDAIAGKTGMKKKDAGTAVDAVFEVIMETLNKQESVSLAGFGTFDVRSRGARLGRNPRTGEAIQIPECTVPVFRAGRRLRECVGGMENTEQAT